MRSSRILYTSLCAVTILAGTSATYVLADQPTGATSTTATTTAAPTTSAAAPEITSAPTPELSTSAAPAPATTSAAPAPATTSAAPAATTSASALPTPPKDKSSANGWIQLEESGAVKSIGSIDSDVVGLIGAVFALLASISSVFVALTKANPLVGQLFRDLVKRVK